MSQATAQPASTVPPPTVDVILRARNINRVFRMGESEVHVLKGVDVTIKRGEFIAIEGRSGSGKSTLLHILGALDAVDGGDTFFEGKDYTRTQPSIATGLRGFLSGGLVKYTLRLSHLAILAAWVAYVFKATPYMFAQAIAVSTAYCSLWVGFVLAQLVVWRMGYGPERLAANLRNKEFGFVFQFYYLLPELNVLENTLLAVMVEKSWLKFRSNRRQFTERAKEVLESLGMGHRLKHRPSQLSGGERQRVAIARALMNKPRVLFADEPTGNLDAETGRQIMDVLEALHRDHGQTIVMVTHDRALAREADRVLVLKEGRLVKNEDGK